MDGTKHLQNEWTTNKNTMEIDADDAEPMHITGEWGDDLKCHMTILTTTYHNHTILDPPQMSYDDDNGIV